MKKLQFLSLCALFLFVLIIFPNSISAKDEWLQVRSKNFNLIGNASEKDIRKVGAKLEQFRETFRQLFQSNEFELAVSDECRRFQKRRLI